MRVGEDETEALVGNKQKKIDCSGTYHLSHIISQTVRHRPVYIMLQMERGASPAKAQRATQRASRANPVVLQPHRGGFPGIADVERGSSVEQEHLA